MAWGLRQPREGEPWSKGSCLLAAEILAIWEWGPGAARSDFSFYKKVKKTRCVCECVCLLWNLSPAGTMVLFPGPLCPFSHFCVSPPAPVFFCLHHLVPVALPGVLALVQLLESPSSPAQRLTVPKHERPHSFLGSGWVQVFIRDHPFPCPAWPTPYLVSCP